MSPRRFPGFVPPPRPQTVSIEAYTRNGGAYLEIFSYGVRYTVDPTRLVFAVRRRGVAGAQPAPFAVRLRTPHIVRDELDREGSGSGVRVFEADAEFPRASSLAGMYDVTLDAAPDFARTGGGAALPVTTFASNGGTIAVWYPAEHAAVDLAALQRRFVGRDAYAYGGIAMGCADSSKGYLAATPLRVRTIARAAGRVEYLGTGSTLRWDGSASFFAVDPLRIVFVPPQAKPFFTGSGGWGGASTDRDACPAIDLADWQVDETLATEPPPPGIGRDPYTGPTPHVGMTRGEIAWILGFPTIFDDRAGALSRSVWPYAGHAPFASSVTFDGDRVAAYDPPGRLP